MKALSKTFVLLLAAFGLASCGGGGGGSQGAFQPTPSDTISISASSTSITTNGFITLTVTVKKHDGTIENDGTQVTASVTPVTMGSVSGTAGGGATATNTLAGGKTTFIFTSGNQTGTATVTMSLAANTNGSPTATAVSIPITVTAGNSQDPRLQFSVSNTALPLSPYDFATQEATPFPGNFPGSPYVSEVVITWRHTGGALVSAGDLNVSVSPSTVVLFSTDAENLTTFHDLKPSGIVHVTGGVESIFVHAGNVPGTATLSVTATDPDSGLTISSQLQFTVAGAASSLPSSITVSSGGAIYISGSGGAQSTVVSATVLDGNNAHVPDPSGFDNVQFDIVAPAGSDARLSGLNAAGQAVSGTTISTVTHNGVASVTVQSGTQQGPIEIRATADRGDNNVDNGIQDPISATTTIVVSDGKLFSLTITSPDTGAIAATAVSTDVTEDPVGSTNYELPISVKGVDRFGNAVLPGTVVRFGAVDTPQSPTASSTPQGWFSISGSAGDPQEGGTLFTATDGKFTSAGGGVQLGDTLLVFGKEATSQSQNNDDLESAAKVRTVNSATSLTLATPFNLNDGTGIIENYGPVIPYLVGRATFASVGSPAFTDAVPTNNNVITGVATTTLNYPASAVGKAVAIWAQSNSTDYVSHQANIVTDTAVLVFPGLGPGQLTASPDPLLGDATVPVTVCYSDSLGQPIANFRLNFSFTLPAGATGKVDNIASSGAVDKLTGTNGCVTLSVTTSGLPAGSTPQALTFTAGVTSATTQAPSVSVGFVVNIASMQVSPCNISTPVSNATIVRPIDVTILSSSGGGVGGQSISGVCTTSDPTAMAALTPGSATTDSSGTASFTVTLTNFDPLMVTPPTATGVCTFTGPDNLTGHVIINGACINDGFSP